ncbi:FAD:protein FMN transferase [Rothia nasimurium]|nr:FAD:protein FMN transferase [Rothia nasimurium]
MLAENWQVWTSPAQLLIDSSNEADLAVASAAVQGVLIETNAAINTFEPTSELATINAAGEGTYTLSATLAQVLAQAITAYPRTSFTWCTGVPTPAGQQSPPPCRRLPGGRRSPPSYLRHGTCPQPPAGIRTHIRIKSGRTRWRQLLHLPQTHHHRPRPNNHQHQPPGYRARRL